MMRNASSWVPLWMSEGLAEFYQNTDFQEKEVLMGQPSAGDLLYLRQNRLLPLTTLLTVDRTSPYYHEEQKGSIFYAESWALTHYLEVGDVQKGTTRLQDYANLLVKNTDPLAAAQQAFGDLAQLQKSLFAYISQDRFMMFKMNKSSPRTSPHFRRARSRSPTRMRSVPMYWSTMSGRKKHRRCWTPYCAMTQTMPWPTKQWAISNFARGISRVRANGTARRSN